MSRAIQWYSGLLGCNHWVVRYAPITVISPLIWDDQVALGENLRNWKWRVKFLVRWCQVFLDPAIK